MTTETELGQRLKYYRELRGYTRNELGVKADVNPQLVYKYENGTIREITTKNIEKLAKALKISPAMLAGWADDEDSLSRELSGELKRVYKKLEEILSARK